MTAAEFNDLTTNYATELLYPLGFKQAGIHFYIHNSPNLMVFYKKTFRGLFEGFYLAFTHDFLPDATDQKGKIKIPAYLENYPFSIPLTALKEQYTKHMTATDFTFDSNFITREVLATNQFTKKNPMDIFTFDNIQHNSQNAENYIKSSIDTVITDGMKLLREYSPVISYMAVTRHKGVDNTTLNKHKTGLEKYLADNKIEIPERNKSWIHKFFNR